MANSLIGNAAVATHMYQALYGQAPSYALYNSYIADIAANGQAAFAKTLAGNFNSPADTDAALALRVLNNLGVTATTVTAIRADGTSEYAFLLNQLELAFTGYPTMRGQVILNATNLFGNLEADPTYGAAATTYNKQALANFTYASNTANTTPGTAALPDPTIGQPFSLTTGLDKIVGTAANDTITGQVGASATLTVLDSIDGKGGDDVLTVTDLAGGTAFPAALAVTGVETLNFVAAGAAAPDTSTGFTGLTKANVTASATGSVVVVGDGTAVSVTATGATSVTATDSALAVTNAAGTVTAAGGSTQVITTAGGYVASGATGAITVTDTAQAAVNSTIDDGTSVTLTTTAKAAGATTGTIGIGATAPPTGAVTVVSNLSNVKSAATDGTGGAITVKGGSTVSVTQTAVQAVMTTASTNAKLTQAAVTVTGTSDTTSVSVTQAAAVSAANTVLAASAVTETASTVFGALTTGQTVILGGLTFAAGSAGTTAAQTAAAFANLASGATQGNSALGGYTGTFTGWTSAAASGTGSKTVVFTSTGTGDVANLADTGSGAATTITTTAGVAAATAAGKGGIVGGVVQITDVNYATPATAGKIATVSLDGYAGAAGTTFVKSNALTSLSLANSTGKDVWVYDKTATTLGLTVNKLGAASTLDLDKGTAGTYTALNVTTATADSVLAVTASGVTALTVTGTKALDLSSSAFGALKTVVVSGAAGVTLVASGGTVTGVNAADSSGANTFTIDATKATYAGGSGVDTVTTSAAAPTKAISLGAGNDKLTLATGTTSATGAISGGDGTDTLSMDAGNADSADATTAFAAIVTGFEVLQLTGATGVQAVDVTALGNYSNVISTASAGTLTIDKLVSGGTFTIAGNSSAYVVNVTDATTGTSDVLNLVLSSSGALTAGTVTAAKVETIAITSTDTNTTAHADTLTLTAADATAVTVAGNAALTLTMTGSTKVASINASSMTAGLTVISLNTTTASTLTGGTGADVLTAATGTTADVLVGGAGADTLTVNAGLDSLTGGAGNDLFVITTPGANVNVYSTIADAAAGDRIQLASQGVETFNTTKLSLGDTAVFQDFANLAAAGTGAVNGAISWFQFAGNTYIVEDLSAGASFVNGVDVVVKLTGLVDLSSASLNIDGPTLLIA
jgi:S-layer protein